MSILWVFPVEHSCQETHCWTEKIFDMHDEHVSMIEVHVRFVKSQQQ